MSDEPHHLTELEQNAKALGEQLGYLLHGADLPDEEKSAWLTLIPHMEMEHIDHLMFALARYNVAPANEAITEVVVEIETAKEYLEERITVAAATANEAFDEIETLLADPV